MTELDEEVVVQRTLECRRNEHALAIIEKGVHSISGDFRKFLAEMRPRHVRISPYHPRSNSTAEALHKTASPHRIRREPFFDLQLTRNKVKRLVGHHCNNHLHTGIWYLVPYEVLTGDERERLSERDWKPEAARRRRRERAGRSSVVSSEEPRGQKFQMSSAHPPHFVRNPETTL